MGVVMFGKPLSSKAIADELCLSARAVRYQLKKLEDSRYIQTEKTKAGQIIKIRKSVKWRNRSEARPNSAVRPQPRENAIDRLMKYMEGEA